MVQRNFFIPNFRNGWRYLEMGLSHLSFIQLSCIEPVSYGYFLKFCFLHYIYYSIYINGTISLYSSWVFLSSISVSIGVFLSGLFGFGLLLKKTWLLLFFDWFRKKVCCWWVIGTFAKKSRRRIGKDWLCDSLLVLVWHENRMLRSLLIESGLSFLEEVWIALREKGAFCLIWNEWALILLRTDRLNWCLLTLSICFSLEHIKEIGLSCWRLLWLGRLVTLQLFENWIFLTFVKKTHERGSRNRLRTNKRIGWLFSCI